MEFQEYPKMLYENGDVNQQKIVNSQAEEEAAGDEWIDEPLDPAALVA